MDEESLLSPEAMATAAATQELKSLQALHASLRALKEMMKAVNKDYTTLAENYEKLAGTSECLYSFIHVLCTLSLTLQKQMTSGRYSLPQKVTVQLNNQDDHIYTPKCISVVFVTALLSVFTSVGSDVRM